MLYIINLADMHIYLQSMNTLSNYMYNAYLFTINEHIVELYLQQRLPFPSECASLSSATRWAKS
jgi:hypothetical protein